jgi:hypothetical protein
VISSHSQFLQFSALVSQIRGYILEENFRGTAVIAEYRVIVTHIDGKRQA